MVIRYFLILILLLPVLIIKGQEKGFEAFEGKNLRWTVKEKKPGLFNKIEKDKVAIQIKFQNKAEESIQLKFQLFVYQKGMAKSESQETLACLKPGKKKKMMFMIAPLGSDDEWTLENASASIVEDCPAK